MRFRLCSVVGWLGLALTAGAAPVASTGEKAEPAVHWAFVPPRRVAPPAVKRKDWPRNPVDYFILSRLEKERIKTSPQADRVTLIRRLSLDLTGLLPTMAEVDAFVKDRRPDAFERVVERLLASPHYGERWGRLWLDVARYADSNGYSIDAPRSIWKYRDWVIGALNRDLPFDQFAIEQLAGDLLPNATVEQKIATGFNRNTQINQEGGIDPEQFRVESVMDRVNTTATAFLGVTLACAQCHDHKFDPLTQRDYYRFYAFFNNTIEDGHGKGAPEGMLEIPGESEALENRQKELEEAEADLDRYLDTKGSELMKAEDALTAEESARLKPDVRKFLKIPFAERTKKQKRTVYAVVRPDDSDFKQRNSKLAKLEKNQPKPVTTLVMVEREQPRETTVFIKGDFTRPGARVTPDVPAILPALPVPVLPSRLDLARWIASTNNPLTARVIVNRIWQQYFGRGLVETENDFGTQGAPPSHPELLDWLACELMNPGGSRREESRSAKKARHAANERGGDGSSPDPVSRTTFEMGTGRPHPVRWQAPTAIRDEQSLVTSAATDRWSLKHLHRLIVTSAAYRQSSKARPDLAVVDPNNKLLARQTRLRLDAEIVRDVCLSASGLLDDKIGGPSVFPPQPDGVMNLGQSRREWKPSTGSDRYRRGLYTFFWRATPHPALMIFDSADGFSTCTRRVRSNTPLQALTLLNDEAFHEFAQAVAARVLKEGPKSDSARIEYAFRLCLARFPATDEKRRLLDLLNKELVALKKSPAEAAAMLQQKPDHTTDVRQLAAWTTVSRVLLNLDEAITRE